MKELLAGWGFQVSGGPETLNPKPPKRAEGSEVHVGDGREFGGDEDASWDLGRGVGLRV